MPRWGGFRIGEGYRLRTRISFGPSITLVSCVRIFGLGRRGGGRSILLITPISRHFGLVTSVDSVVKIDCVVLVPYLLLPITGAEESEPPVTMVEVFLHRGHQTYLIRVPIVHRVVLTLHMVGNHRLQVRLTLGFRVTVHCISKGSPQAQTPFQTRHSKEVFGTSDGSAHKSQFSPELK